MCFRVRVEVRYSVRVGVRVRDRVKFWWVSFRVSLVGELWWVSFRMSLGIRLEFHLVVEVRLVFGSGFSIRFIKRVRYNLVLELGLG